MIPEWPSTTPLGAAVVPEVDRMTAAPASDLYSPSAMRAISSAAGGNAGAPACRARVSNQSRVPGMRKPWATIYTKRLAGVDLVLNGPKGAFQLGSVAEIGSAREVATDGEDKDQVRLRFVTVEELYAENFSAFLRAHLESLRAAHVA